jgi:hypothetical protein
MGTAIVDWRKKQNNYPPFAMSQTACLSTHPARILTGHKLKDDL